MGDQLRTVVGDELRTLFEEQDQPVPAMTDDLVLLDSGLDSLGFAVLVTRLEDTLGYDPFTEMAEPVYPRTLGEFLDIYQRFAPADGDR